MNKKLIKTITIITCGLGIVSSIPFMATSCGSNDSDDTGDELKYYELKETDLVTVDHTVVTDSNTDVRYWWNAFTDDFRATFTYIKEQGYNAFRFPTTSNMFGYCMNYTEFPLFITAIEFPRNTIAFYDKLSDEKEEIKSLFPETVTEIGFYAEELYFGSANMYGTYAFDYATNVNTLVFNDIQKIGKIGNEHTNFAKLGSNVEAPVVQFGESISSGRRESVQTFFTNRHMPSNWTYEK